MRHNRKVNHLSRTYSHRAAMLSNMAVSLIMHKRIFTTLAKAKELRKYVEPIITKSKNDTTHSRRLAFKELRDKYAVTELFQNVSQKIEDRPGGYTRIIKTGYRLGDNASMCFIELVDYNELMLKEKSTKASAKTTRRSRRGTGKKATEVTEVIGATEEVTEVTEATLEEVVEKPTKKETAKTPGKKTTKKEAADKTAEKVVAPKKKEGVVTPSTDEVKEATPPKASAVSDTPAEEETSKK
jgi:large subunit ribosomal protein L17